MNRLMALLFVLAVLVACVPTPTPTEEVTPKPEETPKPGGVVWELFTDEDYRGPVQRGVVSPAGEVAYLATMATLYQVGDGEAWPIAERPEEEARLALAPGGGVYAWLIPEPDWQGLFFVRLMDISGEQLAELQLEEFPYGFGALYLGFEGNLIVTASPVDDWESLEGRFQYTFWNQEGEALDSVIRPGRQIGLLDPSGTAILLLGEQEATAFSASGKQLWQLSGHFRKGAIAGDGNFALLNPASREAIDQVFIYDGSGDPTIVYMPTPVHDLTVAPDGSLAVVVGDQGRYFYLELASADLQEGPPLPFDGTFYISDAEFVNIKTLALGVIHRAGEPPQYIWPSGTIIVVDREGGVAFQKEFDIREPIAFVPAIDVDFDGQFFIGFTQDTTILVSLGQ
jgi:hypothetical protein